MNAGLSASKLQEVWKTLLQQTGPFKSIIDEWSQAAPGGITAVTLGCQFERASLNAILAFDGETRIAGLRFVLRPLVAIAPAPRLQAVASSQVGLKPDVEESS
jgi:Protein of unknown function (DUF3887)